MPMSRTKPQLRLFTPWVCRLLAEGIVGSGWYESMSRTLIRDVPFNQPRCRLSTGETCRIVD